MKFILIISLLCSIAFSAPVLNGAEVTQTVTINHLAVAETNGHFHYQKKIPRVGSIELNVDSANDVGFTRVNDTIRLPRWVIFTTDTIYLYAYIAVSSTADTSYRLQYGKSLNEVNSSAAFTNCGIVGKWGFDSSLTDYSNGYTLTPTNFDGTYPIGQFSRAATFGANTSMEYGGSILSNRSTFTVSFILKPTLSFSTTQIIFSDRDVAVARFQIQAVANKLQVYVGSASNYAEISNVDTELPQNTASLLTIVYNGSGATNSDKIKIYIYNSLKTASFTGTIPTVMPTYTGFVRYGWPASNLSYRGDIDNSMIMSTYRTLQGVATSYNMLFNSSTFSTLGTPLTTEFSAEMGIDTLTFVCSAENATSYQWYLDGSAMAGETDSILVIYADSAFYAVQHTIYCMADGVKSGEWVVTQPTSTGSRWSRFLRNIGFGRGH